jgi:anti-sigma B factor antagonist
MQLTAEQITNGIVRLVLDGRMDIEGTQVIDIRLAAHTAVDRGAFIIDLGAVSFLASIGIRSLVSAAKAVRGRGGRLVLLSTDPNVDQTLRTAGIDKLIPMFANVESACQALAAG